MPRKILNSLSAPSPYKNEEEFNGALRIELAKIHPDITPEEVEIYGKEINLMLERFL